MKDLIKNKKILLVGLGKLGGGVATARFLVENGANLTVTDLNSEKELKNSLNKLKNFRIKYALGEHREDDFKNNDIIIFNQAVSAYNKWVLFARKNKKQIETDLSLMLKILEEQKPKMEYVAITGTRGKTTTTTWTHHFLKPAFIGGNIPELAPLKVLEKYLSKNDTKPLVLEIPSYQLEYFELNKKLKAPKVAAITNLYVDHLNRHGNMENYALAKSRIFSNQGKNYFLLLNYDADNKLFLRSKPKSQIFYISLKSLPADKNGLYFEKENIFFQKNKKNEFIASVSDFSQHQKYNLLMSLLSAYLYGSEGWEKLSKRISSLPEIKFRQEVVLKTKKITIINDSTATSPEATIASIERFFNGVGNVLICGGTDKSLDFKNLARKIVKNVSENNLYLLNGSATKKLVDELKKLNIKEQKLNIFDNLKNIIDAVKKRKDISLIVFSPGAASFEKFKNEFDRGRKFNALIKNNFK